MLEYLSIKNLALIEEIEVEFGPGLNVITGVTGAGKTLLLKALQLCLGERADYDLLSSDEEEAGISVIFSGIPDDILPPAWADSGEIHLRRVLKEARRSPAYLNDQRVRLETLQQLQGELIDFHGQHEGQAVFEAEFPRRVLDRYGEYDGLLEEYRDVYKKYAKLRQEKEKLEDPDSSYRQRLQLLSYQVRELDEFEPRTGEWEEIEDRRRELESAEEIDSQLRQALGLLEAERSLPELMNELGLNIEKVGRFREELAVWTPEIDDIKSRLEELRRQLHETREKMSHSEMEYEQLLDRRGNWLQLARKHNLPPESLADHYLEVKEELDALKDRENRLEELAEEIKKYRKQLDSLGDKLSRERLKTARKLEKQVLKRLKLLKLEEAVFKIEVEPVEPGPYGKDRVGWLFASHSSAEPGHFSDRVSGGEISRVLLAIKSSLAEADTTPVLVFDEIDTGISGEEADSVGRLLSELSEFHQIICITHLPLVAARADHHILLNRRDSKNEVVIDADIMDEKGKIEELSRLISGDQQSEVSRRQARQLLEG